MQGFRGCTGRLPAEFAVPGMQQTVPRGSASACVVGISFELVFKGGKVLVTRTPSPYLPRFPWIHVVILSRTSARAEVRLPKHQLVAFASSPGNFSPGKARDSVAGRRGGGAEGRRGGGAEGRRGGAGEVDLWCFRRLACFWFYGLPLKNTTFQLFG